MRKAATKSSWKTIPMPTEREQLPLRLSLTKDEFEKVKLGFVPDPMEQKWFILFEDGWLNFYRAWTGFCVFQLRLQEAGDTVQVTEAWANRHKEQHTETDIDKDMQFIRVIVKEHFDVPKG